MVILLEIAILGGLAHYKFFPNHWIYYREGFVEKNLDPVSEWC
jgi:hypothetical protein